MPISKIKQASIDASALTGSNITDGTIAAADLATDAVTTAKIADGGITTAKIATDAITTAKIADTVNLRRRNLVINGAMQCYQRQNYTITTAGSPEYGGLDRFHVWTYTSSEQVVANITQDADVPSGQGFSHSYKFDVTTAESAVASGEALLVGQFIEAQNVQHLEYGTSSAKDVTMSFWIKSSKTGTYCFNINQPDGARVYVKEYTVSSANTWEKKIITIPGDASGTINNDNGRGLWLQWVLMAGTDRQGSANAWRGSQFELATSNQVNALDNTSNNIFLTGIQLEVGDTATPFEHRSFAEELSLCERYYFQTYQYGTAAGTATRTSCLGRYVDGAGNYSSVQIPNIRMRAAPTATIYSTNTTNASGKLRIDTGDINGVVADNGSNGGGFVYANNVAVANQYGLRCHIVLDAEL